MNYQKTLIISSAALCSVLLASGGFMLGRIQPAPSPSPAPPCSPSPEPALAAVAPAPVMQMRSYAYTLRLDGSELVIEQNGSELRRLEAPDALLLDPAQLSGGATFISLEDIETFIEGYDS